MPLGTSALAFGLACAALLGLRQVVFREHRLAQAALAFCFALLTELIVACHASWLGWHPSTLIHQIEKGLYAALYNAAVAPLVFWMLLRVAPLRRRRRAAVRGT